jgi:glycosyltransferase involved in cell wall biosynthesis
MTNGPTTVPAAGPMPGTAPVRVAFVVASASGGTAAHVAALAAGCRDAGLAVRAFGPAATAGAFGPGIAFEPVRIAGRPRPASDAATIARLRRTLRSWRPGVVHAHGVRAGAFAAVALLAGQQRVPPAGAPAGGTTSGRPSLVVTVHNAPPVGRFGRLAYGVLERLCAWRADAVLCASEDLAVRMRRLGATEVRLFDVAAPVAAAPSDEQIAKARAEIGADGRPVVLGVGRLVAQKGFDVLVTAAARWRGRNPAPLTVIAGDGPLVTDLHRQARQARADVLLLGRRDDVPALLAVADVVAVPSRWEARALVLQEAMRSGRPVVATRVGGTPGLTGEDSAVLIEPDDPTALATAVIRLLDDPPLAAALGRAALARSGTFPTQEDSLKAALGLYAALAR